MLVLYPLVFRSLFLLCFLQPPSSGLSETESRFLQNVADLWNLQSAVRLLKHLASASDTRFILSFCTIQRQRRNPAMSSVVLGMWKAVTSELKRLL